MKKIFLSLIVLTLAFAGCKKTEETTPTGGGDGGTAPVTIVQDQNAVAFYLSGNWCGPCGLYGKPAMKNVIAKHGDDIVVVACHLNGQGAPDPLNVPAANALASAWGVSGVPTCALGGAGMPGMKVGGGSAMETNIENQFSVLVGNKATTGTSIDATLANGELTIKTNTKFFGATADEHFMSVYVTEDAIKGTQYISGQGWDNNAVHNNVLRKSLATAATGDSFATSATDGEEISKDFTTSVESTWNASNLKVAVVIWKQGSNGRTVVNGTVVNVK